LTDYWLSREAEKHFPMDSIKSLLTCLVVLLFITSGASYAQEAKAQETEKEAIYLEEPEAEPPAKLSRRRTLKEVYKDKTPRAERQVAQFSDDTIVNDGTYVEFYRDGKKYVEGNYKMGVFDGKWQYWYPNGQLCKAITFVNGKPNGQWEVFDEAGKRTARKSYQNGKRHGPWKTYYPGGEQVKFEMQYEQGVVTGKRIAYHKNGQKSQEATFKGNKREGPLVEWYENGEKSAEAVFQAGVIVGKVKRFKQTPAAESP